MENAPNELTSPGDTTPERWRLFMRGLLALATLIVTGCPPTTIYPRAICQSVSGAYTFNGRQRIIVNGMPSPEPEVGTSCVESGHTGAQPGVVFVDADNPRVWTNIQLGSAPIRHEGDAHQIVESTTLGWACHNCDFDVQVGGGDGPATSGPARLRRQRSAAPRRPRSRGRSTGCASAPRP
jgi:hypothetical protein